MIYDLLNEQNLCPKHNLYEEFENPDKSHESQQYACRQCIIEYHNLTPIQLPDENQNYFERLQTQFQQNFNGFNAIIQCLKSIQEAFHKAIKIIENIIGCIKNEINSTQNKINQYLRNQEPETNNELEKHLMRQKNFKLNIAYQIDILVSQYSIDKIVKTLNKLDQNSLNDQDAGFNQPVQRSLESISILLNKFNNETFQPNRFQYQLLPNSTLKQQKQCKVVAFNYDNSIVGAGCEKEIKLFKFKNEKLRELQALQGHQSYISCLHFMKKRNLLFSGSFDFSVRVWEQNQKKVWMSIQTFQLQNTFIECFIMNSNEDQLISGSSDASIIIWKPDSNNWKQDQEITCSSQIKSLSLNDSSEKLISLEQNNLITVFELQEDQWLFIQSININLNMLGLGFLSENRFVLISQTISAIHLYNFDLQDKMFQKVFEQKINMKGIHNDLQFPFYFIKSKNLLILKEYNCVKIFRKSEDRNFIEEQQIQFDSENFYVTISEDGMFLISSNFATQEFQIRKLNKVN